MEFIRQLEYKLRVTISFDQRSSSRSGPSIRIQGLKQDVSKADYEIRAKLFNLNAGLMQYKHQNDIQKTLKYQHVESEAKKAEQKKEKETFVANLVSLFGLLVMCPPCLPPSLI